MLTKSAFIWYNNNTRNIVKYYYNLKYCFYISKKFFISVWSLVLNIFVEICNFFNSLFFDT